MLKDNDIIINKPYKRILDGRVGILDSSSISHGSYPVYQIQWTDDTIDYVKKSDFIQQFEKVTRYEYNRIYDF
jgi:hypothetical protein